MAMKLPAWEISADDSTDAVLSFLWQFVPNRVVKRIQPMNQIIKRLKAAFKVCLSGLHTILLAIASTPQWHSLRFNPPFN